MTGGQRGTATAGVLSEADNLESREGLDALKVFWGDLVAGWVEGITLEQYEDQTGLTLTDENGNLPASPSCSTVMRSSLPIAIVL